MYYLSLFSVSYFLIFKNIYKINNIRAVLKLKKSILNGLLKAVRNFS